MLERQLEYERVRLEAESRKADLESQEKARYTIIIFNFLAKFQVHVLLGAFSSQ